MWRPLDPPTARGERCRVIRRIVENNKLNGVAFSTIEFLLAAAAAGFIAIAFGLHQRWLGVALVAGTALNCLVVVAFGVAAWRRGERGNALRDVFDAKRREGLNREHSTMMKDTLTLTIAALVRTRS